MLDFVWHDDYAAPMIAVVGHVTEYHIALAIHVATVIITFGVIFARPLVFAAANRQDQRSLPLLHRIEYTIERVLVLPGVLMVILSGLYMANWEGNWGAFYVWWGIGVVALIGAALTAVMIPTAKRAEAVVARDLRASPTDAIGLSGEYGALTRRLAVVSSVLCVLVLITMLVMGVGLESLL
jgi:hypothetical protein